MVIAFKNEKRFYCLKKINITRIYNACLNPKFMNWHLTIFVVFYSTFTNSLYLIYSSFYLHSLSLSQSKSNSESVSFPTGVKHNMPATSTLIKMKYILTKKEGGEKDFNSRFLLRYSWILFALADLVKLC